MMESEGGDDEEGLAEIGVPDEVVLGSRKQLLQNPKQATDISSDYGAHLGKAGLERSCVVISPRTREGFMEVERVFRIS